MQVRSWSTSIFEPVDNDKLLERIRVETRFSSTGTIQAAEAAPSEKRWSWIQSYRARAYEGLPHHSMAINDEGMRDGLEAVRSFLITGRLAEADLMLNDLEQQSKASDAFKYFRMECGLERARFFFYSAQWDACLELTGQCLQSSEELPAVTRLTLLQVQAAALAELGRSESALRLLDRIDLIAASLPFGNVPFYAKNLRAKLLFASQSAADARKILEQLWREDRKSLSAADRVLTLARAEIVFEMKSPQSVLNWWRLVDAAAVHLSDPLYRGVAACEAYSRLLTFGSPAPFSLVVLVRESKLNYEWCAKIAPSYDAQSLCADAAGFPGLWHSGRKHYIDARTFEVFDLSRSERLPELMTLICDGVRSVSEIFRRLYGMSYVPHLHRSVVKTLVSRLRKALPLDIHMRGDILESSSLPLIV